jgi:nucleotide-binding universal stress UspA family protein
MLAAWAPDAARCRKPAMNEIKTLLWHLDGLSAEGRRLPLVRELARRLDAALEVVYAVTPLTMQFPFAMSAESSAAGQLAACEAEARKTARAAFERACRAAGCTDLPWQATEDEPVRAFSRHAWAADLLVLGQHDPKAEGASGVPADFAASVIMATGKPALILPYIEIAQAPGQNVLVAWKPTRESARALASALPLLQRARQVHVLSWDEADAPGADAVALRYLQRHGVAAQAHAQSGRPPRELGEALLSQAADLQADLLVMGCYGHGRAREWALGGVTRTVLQTMTLPVLMAH